MKSLKITTIILAALLICSSFAACSLESSGKSEERGKEATEEVSDDLETIYKKAYSGYDEHPGELVCLMGTRESDKGTEYVVLEHEGFMSYSANIVYKVRVLTPKSFGRYDIGPTSSLDGVLIGDKNNSDAFSTDFDFEVTDDAKATFDGAASSDLEGLTPVAVIGRKSDDIIFFCDAGNGEFKAVEIDTDGTVTVLATASINDL